MEEFKREIELLEMDLEDAYRYMDTAFDVSCVCIENVLNGAKELYSQMLKYEEEK